MEKMELTAFSPGPLRSVPVKRGLIRGVSRKPRAAPKKNPLSNLTTQVEFRLAVPEALAGDFNDWHVEKLRLQKHGDLGRVSLSLPGVSLSLPRGFHEY